MNAKRLLITAATIGLIAGTTGAFAQQEPSGRAAPNVAPGAMHQGAGAVPGGAAPRNGGAPAQNSAAENSRRDSAGRREPSGQNRTGQVQQNPGRGETTGQAAPRNESHQNRASEEGGRDVERNRLSSDRENGSRGQNRATEHPRSSPSTTGQGTAPVRGAVNISPEQRTRLDAIFAGERNGPRVNDVDFGLAVGKPVPRSVHFIPIPQAIFAIEPEWRGFDYFMVGDQIVIVDPRSMEVVAILEG
jgi:Protein of unknown function (DUF1236)